MLVSTELVLCSLSAAAPHPFPQCHMFSLSPAFICNRVFLRSTYTASSFQPGKQRVGSTLYLSFHFPSQSFRSSPRQKALAARSDRTGDSCVIPGGAAGQWKGLCEVKRRRIPLAEVFKVAKWHLSCHSVLQPPAENDLCLVCGAGDR